MLELPGFVAVDINGETVYVAQELRNEIPSEPRPRRIVATHTGVSGSVCLKDVSYMVAVAGLVALLVISHQ